MKGSRNQRERPALDAAGLEQAALHYAARFATTRRKLADYLRRKVRERGWEDDGEPPIDALIGRLVDLGYVDDRAFAAGRSAALLRRGFGERRIDAALRGAGIADEDRPAREEFDEQAGWEAALRLAEKRHIGPFAREKGDRAAQEKAMAILLRAGHPVGRARRIVTARAGEIPAWDDA
jgi:regulatory protein